MTTTAWSVHVEHVRRRWALVVLVAVVAGVVSTAALLLTGPSWTGRAALAIISQNRSPDQDAVLGRGYVDLFNQPSLQAEYARRDGLGPEVTFSARLAVGTPIIYVEAVAADPGVAGRAATALAVTLRDDVRNNVTGERVQAATDLTTQIQGIRARLAGLSPTSPERAGLTDQIGQLQNQLTTVQANSTNQLRDLQLDAGVTRNILPVPRTAAVGVLGGALLGALAAAALGSLGPGLTSATQVRARLGLDVLADLDRSGPSATEPDRALARVLAHPDLPRPVRLAVTTADHAGESDRTWVAERLARLVVLQGGSSLVLHVDLGERHEAGGGPGLSDALTRPGPLALAGIVQRDPEGVLTIGPGVRPVDPHTVLSRERTAVLLEEAQTLAAVVVVDAPAVTDPGDAGSVVCGLAEATVLVIGPRTRAVAARTALDAVTRGGGLVLGVVTVTGGQDDEAGPAAAPPPGNPGNPAHRTAAPTTMQAPPAAPVREPARAGLEVRRPGPRAAQ